jgi:ribosomal protein S18 acetylase RimI-like enzyme
MDYMIKNITNEQELDNALAFARMVFGDDHTGFGSREESRKEWLGHMERNNDLLLYAESDSEVVGIVFGSIGADGNMTAGIVAVDERLRGRGVAREMMLLLEERGKAYGIRVIGLGAVQAAEGFYAKLGYTGSLLIQSEKHSIDELLSLNTKYKVNYTRVHDGYINQVNLAIRSADRDLQHKYETTLPGCYTQMMFWKSL